MNNSRIAGSLAVPVVLDASGFQAELRNTIAGVVSSAPEMQQAFNRACENIQHRFDNSFSDIGVYWDRVLQKMESRVAKGNLSPITVNTIQGIHDMAEEIGRVDLKLRSLAALDLADKLRLPKVVADFEAVNRQVENLNRSLTALSGHTKYHAYGAGEAGQAAQRVAEQAYADAYAQYATNVSARNISPAGLGGPIGPNGQITNPWASVANPVGMAGPAGLGGRIAPVNPWISATLGMSATDLGPSANIRTSASDMLLAQRHIQRLDQEAMEGEAARARRLAAAGRLDAYGTQRDGSLSAAAAGAYADEARQRRQGAYLRNMDPYGATAPVGLSPATIAANAADSRQRMIDLRAQANMAASDRISDRNVRRQIQRQEDEARQSRLSPEHAGRFRFIAQNVGFGVDDAIQSYQYGGMRGSIRAASNNVTAIAATAIPHPVIAAVAVVALSAISAALPSLLDRLGVDRDTRSMDRHTREEFRRRDPTTYAGERADDLFMERFNRRAELRHSNSEMTSDLRFSSSLDTYAGSDISQMMLKQGQKVDRHTQLEMDKIFLQDRRDKRYEKNRISPGFVLGLTSQFTGNYTDRHIQEMDEQLDKIEAEQRKLSDETGAQQEIIFKARERLAANRKMMKVVGRDAAYTQQDLDRGDLTLAAYEDRVNADAEAHIRRIKAQRLPKHEEEAAIFEVRNRAANKLADPLLRDKIASNRFAASEDAARFDWSHSGPHSNLGGMVNEHNAELRMLQFSINNRGPLNRDEALRRQTLSRQQFKQDFQRAFEDDLDNLNPDVNPASRLQRTLARQTADLEGEADMLSPEQNRKRMLASLRGLDAARARALQPSGTRQFVSSGYRFDSAEDRNLEARMLGQFGDRGGKKYDDSLTLVQIRDALATLNNQLSLDAQELNR